MRTVLATVGSVWFGKWKQLLVLKYVVKGK